MKKWKSMLALVIALGLCASLVGCGNSAGSDGTEENGGASSSEKVKKSQFDFYDDLAAEWENRNKSYHLFNDKDAFEADNGRIYIRCDEGVFSYDPSSKETNVIVDGYIWGNVCYAYGYIYTYSRTNSGGYWVEKYDADGKRLRNSLKYEYNNSGGNIFAATENGEVIINTKEGLKKLSADFSTVTDVPNPQKEVEHGISEEGEVNSFIGLYDGKIIAQGSGPFISALDTDSLEWSYIADTYGSKIVGKYSLSDDVVLDLSTGETIAAMEPSSKVGNTSKYLAYSYSGGKYSTIYNNDEKQCYRGRYADGSNYIEYTTLMPDTENKWKKIFGISDTQYILIDDYGIFLRTYEGGADGEESVYLFNN